MKDWLIKTEKKQMSLFNDLLKQSMKELITYNLENNKDISVRVVFKKDDWLNGRVDLEIVKYFGDEEYDVISKHSHSIHDSNENIGRKNIMFGLMERGLFTNSWFNILDKSRTYDTTILITPNGVILENDDCEYRENIFRKKSVGFNVSTPVASKIRMK